MKKFLIINIVLLLFSCNQSHENQSRVESLPYYEDASFTPKWLSSNDSISNFHKISSFSLINQNGRIITNNDLEDKIYVADFFFTSCPGICPKMTSNMFLIQKEFKNDDDILLLSHSVTPEKDSISVLKKYAEENNIISDK